MARNFDIQSSSQDQYIHRILEWKRLSQEHVITVDGIYLKSDVEGSGKIDEFDFYVIQETVYAIFLVDSVGSIKLQTFNPPKPMNSDDEEYDGLEVDGESLVSGERIQELVWVVNPRLQPELVEDLEFLWTNFLIPQIGYTWFVPDIEELLETHDL